MDILVIGGTRFMGVHLVEDLLAQGHSVTVANRGLTGDCFGQRVKRLVVDRTVEKSVADALRDTYFDVVYDNVAYSSLEVKYILDSVRCGKYIEISTVSVYDKESMSIAEQDFDPLAYPLTWCRRDDFQYDEIKRQAECALFQMYPHVQPVAVRFPYVIGNDDYTKRLYFYVEHIIQSVAMNVDNLDERLSFVNSRDAGQFLARLGSKSFSGAVNAGSYGTISLREIIAYTEEKTGMHAIFSEDGEAGPYNGALSFGLNLSKAEEIGFTFSSLRDWVFDLLDQYIEIAHAKG